MGFLFSLLSQIATTEIEGEITYEMALKYFIAHKDDDERIVKGAMLKEPAGKGFVFLTQVCLDKDDKLVCQKNGKPIGRKLKAINLDDELLAVFKQENLVIVD